MFISGFSLAQTCRSQDIRLRSLRSSQTELRSYENPLCYEVVTKSVCTIEKGFLHYLLKISFSDDFFVNFWLVNANQLQKMVVETA